MGFAEMVITGFEEVTPQLDKIYLNSHTKNIDDWIAIQIAAVTGSGVLATSIPGAHLIGMAADIAFLMNRMSTCSYGIGSIIGHQTGLGNILETEDFALILGLWAGDKGIEDAIFGKTFSIGAMATTGLAQQFFAKEMAKCCGALIGKKLGGKMGAKIGAKFAGKLSGKAIAGFFPFLGSAVSGGLNFYFLNGISNSAMKYFNRKANVY